MRAPCCCSSDSDRCSSCCVRTIRWRSARRATELTRLRSSGPRSTRAPISAATATPICESRSSPTRGPARISFRRSHWRGWRLSPTRRSPQPLRSVSRPGVEPGSGWMPTRRPGKAPPHASSLSQGGSHRPSKLGEVLDIGACLSQRCRIPRARGFNPDNGGARRWIENAFERLERCASVCCCQSCS